MENSISITNYQLNDNFKDYIDCPICYKITNNFYKAECNHSWCNNCNENMKSNLCPLCRKELKIIKKIKSDFSESELEYLRIRREIRRIIRNINIIYNFLNKCNKVLDDMCCIN